MMDKVDKVKMAAEEARKLIAGASTVGDGAPYFKAYQRALERTETFARRSYGPAGPTA